MKEIQLLDSGGNVLTTLKLTNKKFQILENEAKKLGISFEAVVNLAIGKYLEEYKPTC